MAQQILRKQEEHGAGGWIVDRRRNPGGDMYPMIAGLGPPIGEGPCCYFVGPGDSMQAISYQAGEVSDSLRTWITVADPYCLAAPNLLVAVLIGPFTASSGEFTTLALRNRPRTRLFGQPTFGVATGNETKVLGDGAVLFLTVCLGTDRTGDTFDGPIPPDEAVPADWSTFGTTDDPVICRAAEWIETALVD